MTIEFTCEGCGKAMRAPEAAAGKKGQCPQCGVVNVIPAASTPAPSAPAAAERPTASDTIEFACASCGKTMRTPASAAGKKGKCPACGNVTAIPASSTAKAPAKPTAPPAAPKREASAPLAVIEFYCPSCGSMVKTPGEVAGKKGKCPHCQSVVDIPKKSASRKPGAAAPAASAGLTPIGGGGLTPIGGGGLTPIGGGGLTPIGGGGLTPIDGGLTPLGGAPNPFGGPAPGAFPGDPLAGMGGPGFGAPGFGGPGMGAPGFGPADFGGMPAANPYAAPAPAYGGSSRRSGEKPNDSKREGIPWERKGANASFFGTITDVIIRPGDAFSQMRRTGNTLMRAIAFPFLAMLLTVTVASVIFSVVMGVRLLMFGVQNSDRLVEGAEGKMFLAWILGSLAFAAYMFFSSAISMVFGLFAGAGIMHVCLMIVGGARYSYEVTLRVLCYAMGANYMVSVLPCVGIVTIVTYPLSIIVGLAEAHETDKGRTAFAFFLPVLLCMVACGFLFFLGVLAPVMSALSRVSQTAR